MEQNPVVLKMEKIKKGFPGVQALDGVQFDLRKGEVHALLGENGSGKSTLIKVLAGIHEPDSGEITVCGEKVKIKGVADSERLGISTVHQELVLVPEMTVAENMYMGREPLTKFGFVDFRQMNAQAAEVLNNFGSDISPTTKISSLSTAQQQVVEIAKALSNHSRIIIMDEPTASLTQGEVENLFITINQLRDEGFSIIYVSHRMEELFRLTDRITVLRDGVYVGTVETKATTEDELIKMMIGRELEAHNKQYKETKDILLEVKGLSRGNKLKDINMVLRRGEVLGISGIVGAGRTELARVLFGIDADYTGSISIEGKEITIKSPTDAIEQGVALIPESRKEQGLVLMQTVGFNLTISVLSDFFKFVGYNSNKENSLIDDYVKKLRIKVSSKDQYAGKLSGGNQQKIVLAKWLATNPQILILDEPTRGIDIGAKTEIYSLIDSLSSRGIGVIVISSELPEITRLCDTVYVMYQGKMAARLEGKDIDQEKIIRYATGVAK